MTIMRTQELPPRFWDKINVSKDGCWLWAGAKKQGPKDYGFYFHCGKLQMAHRVAFSELVGPIPDGLVIDHVCHKPSCVNPDHLQAVSQKENLENIRGPHRDSTSGIRGVYWYPSKNRWASQVIHNGRRHHGGYFSSKEAAEVSAVRLRNQLFTNNLVDRGGAHA